jgi:alkyl hydroperoxide reductase subunit AhpC
MTFATLMPQFDAINCKLLGLSIDSNYSHIVWLRTIKEKIKYKGMENVEVTFPVIADLKMEVARAYGMLHSAGCLRESTGLLQPKRTFPVQTPRLSQDGRLGQGVCHGRYATSLF